MDQESAQYFTKDLLYILSLAADIDSIVESYLARYCANSSFEISPARGIVPLPITVERPHNLGGT